MINPLNTHYAFENPASIYDEEAMTALQLAGRQGAKINEIIKDQNSLRKETETELSRQVNEVIPGAVSNEVQEHIDSGAFDSKINVHMGNIENELDVLSERMDTFTALPDGSTSGDAELMDIRVGVDGTEYDTAGEAVRAQFARLPYPKDIISGDVNLDEVQTPGRYVINSGINITGIPTNMVAQPFYLTVEELYRDDSRGMLWVLQRIGRWDWQTEYRRIINNGTVRAWLSSDGVLCPMGAGVDMTSVLQTEINRTKHLKLGAGTYELDKLTMPEGSVIEGAGASTIIKTNNGSVSMIIAKSHCTIKNVMLKGQWDTQPDDTTAKTENEVGVYIDGAVDTINIDGCIFNGFTHSGIWMDETGTSVKSVMVNNCEFINNYIGCRCIASEYACFTGCVFRDNYMGMYNLGGNNKFSACGFDSNVYGFIVGGDTNNGHGSAVGCSFNHNIERAISLQAVDYGYIFAGCQVHDGAVLNTSGGSDGILFSGCNFGTGVTLENQSSSLMFFNGCTFYETPTKVTTSDNLKFTDCMNYSGQSIN